MVGWTVREIFIDLYQPSGSGALSSNLGRALLTLARRMSDDAGGWAIGNSLRHWDLGSAACLRIHSDLFGRTIQKSSSLRLQNQRSLLRL